VLVPFDATERGGQRVARDFLDGAKPHNALARAAALPGDGVSAQS
jgi:hypothetical protein